jgi:PAS domain S-box-containing protein
VTLGRESASPHLDETAEVLRSLGDVLFELGPGGVCVAVTGGEDHGLVPKRVLGRHVRELLPADVADLVVRALAEVLEQGVPRTIEGRLPAAGALRWYEARLTRLRSGHAFAIVRDIHEHRSADLDLRRSEARFRLMADHAPVMLWKSGRDSLCDFFNSRWLEFTGRAMEQELGTAWAESVYFEDLQACVDTYMTAFVQRQSFRMEYRMRRADGQFRWILDHGVPRFEVDGTFAGFIGSCIDITEIKEASEKIRKLADELELRVREREVLLREIHHRVKNNLQLISTIFNLQARLLDPVARGLVEEAQNRVRSIALIHEKLCESSSLAHVDFASYVRDLARFVLHVVGARHRLDMRVDCDAMRLGLDQAIPCGLVINELVTNALKHAFTGRDDGCLRVQVRAMPQDVVQITVADDGVGLPPTTDVETGKTLGFDLVTTLLRQLDAEFEVDRTAGTAIRFSFHATR